MNATDEHQQREVCEVPFRFWRDYSDEVGGATLLETIKAATASSELLTDTELVQSVAALTQDTAEHWNTFDEIDLLREGGATEHAIDLYRQRAAGLADEARANSVPVPDDLARAARETLASLRDSGVLDEFPRHEWARVVLANLMSSVTGHSQLQMSRAAGESVESAP